MSRTSRRRSVLATCLVAVTAVLAGCGGLADALRPTAYCSPEDPVVNPTSAAPGDELTFVVSGVGHHAECSSTLPGGARYGISIGSRVDGTGNDDLGSRYYSASVAVLDPDDAGAAEATVRVPDDMPIGEARISVDLQGAKTLCEIDPSASCAPDPFAVVGIVD
ncbi:hypothetical protein [Isoptericola sp. NPDC056605]|uniref:hypothetical protein n=1 Tax=Isoptericola sp. NPDC056605 TaxID=3345876 RepID=UPI0036850505